MKVLYIILLAILLLSLISFRKQIIYRAENFSNQNAIYPNNKVCYLANNYRRCCRNDIGFSKQICTDENKAQCIANNGTWCDVNKEQSSIDEPALEL